MKKLFGVTVAMVTRLIQMIMWTSTRYLALTNMLITKGVDCLYPLWHDREMLRLSASERKSVAQTVVDGK